MDLTDAREAYYDASGTASELCRKLAFAGIALIWVFRREDATTHAKTLPNVLLIGGVLLAATLLLDLFQYVTASRAWSKLMRQKELELGVNSPAMFEAPDDINHPAGFCYVAKMVTLVAAYVLIAIDLLSRL